MSAPELLTTPELAVTLKTSQRTARRYMHAHGIQLSPRVWRMPVARLEELLGGEVDGEQPAGSGESPPTR